MLPRRFLAGRRKNATSKVTTEKKSIKTQTQKKNNVVVNNTRFTPSYQSPLQFFGKDIASAFKFNRSNNTSSTTVCFATMRRANFIRLLTGFMPIQLLLAVWLALLGTF
mmetsp:Transcript_2525/g.2820  ORF Transcript_2525/g.2820 Transcript_2525/m.2820 type:complete len:109 (+) Transcript_2525:66-392(+)